MIRPVLKVSGGGEVTIKPPFATPDNGWVGDPTPSPPVHRSYRPTATFPPGPATFDGAAFRRRRASGPSYPCGSPPMGRASPSAMGRPPAGDASGLRTLFRVGRTPAADSSCMVPPSAKHLSMSNLRSGRRRGFVMFDVGALCYHKARRGGQTLKVRRTVFIN